MKTNAFVYFQIALNEVSQESLSVSKIKTSTFRGYKFKPRANSNQPSKSELKTFRSWDLNFRRLNINQGLA